MIDTRIKTFLTLCRIKNYRKTAEELHMTQPAVTQQIHFLEQEYGCKLFIYDKRTLYMTAEAEILRAYAENVLYQENKAKEQLALASVKHLSIGATKTIGEYVIAPHVASFLEDTGNNISVDVDNTERLLEMISKGDLDFALIEGYFDKKKYAHRLYREEPFFGICEATHPFAGKRISMDALWNEHLFIREQGSGTRDIFEQILRENNHSIEEFRRITVIGNFGLLTKLLKQTHGITFAYQAILNDNEDLASFEIKGRNMMREYNYVYLDNMFSKENVDYFDKYLATKGI